MDVLVFRRALRAGLPVKCGIILDNSLVSLSTLLILYVKFSSGRSRIGSIIYCLFATGREKFNFSHYSYVGFKITCLMKVIKMVSSQATSKAIAPPQPHPPKAADSAQVSTTAPPQRPVATTCPGPFCSPKPSS
jgi:hypothetical protein